MLDGRLDPEHRALFAGMGPSLVDMTDIPGTRARIAAAREHMRPVTIPDGVEITEHRVESSGGAEIALRIHRRRGLSGDAPAVVWLHAGGMVLGDASICDVRCAGLAHELGMVVVSVDYRLAPEHPCPAAIDDADAALSWLHSSASNLGVDAQHIAIAGESAGGCIAAATALRARARGGPPLAFQALIYPMLDDRTGRGDETVDDPRVWSGTDNEHAWCHYLGDADALPPEAVPARVTNLAGLPPTYICVGGLDLFLGESVAYGVALSRAGVSCELHVYPGVVHGADVLLPRSEVSRRWERDLRSAFARALAPRA